MAPPIRILIVDDAAFMRYSVAKHLENDAEIEVIGYARDGVEALGQVKTLKPDVVVMDVEMPRMDGLTALKRIMAEAPTPVIMLSAFTRQGTCTTVQALLLGALDFVSKPRDGFDIRTVAEELKVKIKAAVCSARPARLSQVPAEVSGKATLRPYQKGAPLIIIGASTGGPAALQQILSNLPADLAAAMVIIQHMPPGYTQSLAQRLNQISPFRVQEAAGNDRLALGLALVAPGDYHLVFNESGQVKLDHGLPRHSVRPAIDVTLESAARLYGPAVIGVILTGAGADGPAGARQVKAAGGRIFAESGSTAAGTVPQGTVKAGLADRVIPLPEIVPALVELVTYFFL